MNHSRGRPESEDDDEDNKNLGEAWGGESFSIKSGIKIFENRLLWHKVLKILVLVVETTPND